jgi:AhpC/TSA family
MRLISCVTLLCLLASFNVLAAENGRRVLIYDNLATDVEAPSKPLGAAGTDDLWVTLADLKRATQFVLKPQGVCRDEFCYPIPKKRRSAFLSKVGSVTWFNLSEFARMLRQPAAFDAEQAVWYFGPMADEQNGHIASLIAPDFKLPDANGKPRSLSEFRGKKVLLLTWASW